MGRGIAIAFAYAGHRIALVDLRDRTPQAWQKLCDEASTEIRTSLEGLAQLGALEATQIEVIASRVELVDAPQAGAALADAELVFEGVPETLEAKREAFEQLNRHCRDDAILTSTTSSILVTQLAELVRKRGVDARVTVAEQVHPPRADGIEIAPAFEVVEPAALSPRHRDERQRFVVLHLRAGMPHGRQAAF